QSSGRGGAGNIRQASASREARPQDGPDDFSPSRGREFMPAITKTFSTGRGGVGNIRSPREIRPTRTWGARTRWEEEVIRAHMAELQETPFSSGRGGAGNIQKAGSRSRSRGPAVTSPRAPSIAAPPMAHVRSTGRGGAGNIVPGADGYLAELNDEEERRNLSGRAGQNYPHAVGRGGVANITTAQGPGVELPVHAHSEYESTGRGGAGNIVRDRSVPRS
ncbi:hypothetical protein FPV67DRAFT_1435943, partial [Lyophyllum atratum]